MFPEKVSIISNHNFSTPRYTPETLELMIQNSTSLFAYWRLSERKASLIQEHFDTDWRQLEPSLRLYDVTGLAFDGSRAGQVRHFPIGEAHSCYLTDLPASRTYIADLGIMNSLGQFIPLLRSQRAALPAGNGDHVPDDSAFANPEPASCLLLPYEHGRFSAYTIYPSSDTDANADDADPGSEAL